MPTHDYRKITSVHVPPVEDSAARLDFWTFVLMSIRGQPGKNVHVSMVPDQGCEVLKMHESGVDFTIKYRLGADGFGEVWVSREP